MNKQPHQLLAQYAEEYDYIVGVDETGWGSVAGPLVIGAVVLPRDIEIPAIIKDSKKLSPTGRQEASQWVYENSKVCQIAFADASSFKDGASWPREFSMVKAITEATNYLEGNILVLIDGVYSPPLDIEGVTIKTMIKGDRHCKEIAAASIVAKVAHDDAMVTLHESWPLWGWNVNKGYGTKEHLELIEQHGAHPIYHRFNIKKIGKAKLYEISTASLG